MIQIIAGAKGKGKTKHVLSLANEAIKTAHGSVVYLDKNTKHMFELNNKIRLINVFDYPVHSLDSFLGFICGIISQDHDLECVFLDSFLTVANIESSEEIEKAIEEFKQISKRYNVKFVLSVSRDEDELPANAREKVIMAL